ncbi:Sigma-adaptin 3A [Amphichorda felina]
MLIEDYYKMRIFCSRIAVVVANIGNSRFKLLSKRWRQRRQLPRAGDTIGPSVTETSIQQRLISEIFTLVSNRPSGSCNFLPLPPLLAASGTSHTSSEEQNDVPSLVTYRNYATLYFIIISTSTESPLALIDLIQVYVEALDKLFENVCELDLIFNFETLHATLSEMIIGGVVVETSLDRIVAGVKAQGTVAKRPVNEGRGTGIGAGLGMGSNFVWTGR